MRDQATAYYFLAGGVIRRAIDDYRTLRFHSRGDARMSVGERRRAYRDAKNFLFTDRLPNFIVRFGLESIVNSDAIRAEATRPKM